MAQISKSVGRSAPNLHADARTVQTLLNRYRTVGQPLLKVDGLVGMKTIQAIEEFQRRYVHMARPDGVVDPGGRTLRMLQSGSSQQPPIPNTPTPPVIPGQSGRIAWGAKVSPGFKQKVISICQDLELAPDFLMAAMAFESGETFSPSIKNAAGSGAVGLIQFMPSTAKALGTSTEALAAMSGEAQLDYVKRYFGPKKGRLHSIEDVYMAILYPIAIGKGADHILFSQGTTAYKQNAGLDSNSDGRVTVGEAAAKVRAKLEKGLRPGYIG